MFLLFSLVLGLGVGHWASSVSSEVLPNKMKPEKKRASHWVNNRIDFAKASQVGVNNLQLKPIMDKLLRGELPKDWDAELNKILDIATPDEKSQALLIFFTLWAQRDIDAAMARASVMGGVYTKEVKNEILKQLVDNDPMEAARYYQDNKDNLLFDYGHIVRDIAKKWAKKSPEEAWAWCLTLDNPQSVISPQRSALSAFMDDLDVTDSGLVKTYLEKFKQIAGVHASTTITNWASQNPEAALDWAVSVKDENNNYLSAAILGVAKKDLKRAEELLEAFPRNRQIGMISQISSDIRNNLGPERALAWVMDKVTPAELEKDSHLLFPISPWTNQSPGAAMQWVAQLPTSVVKDDAITQYASSLNDSSFYDKTFELINSMESHEKKEATLKLTLQNWEKTNKGDFKKWIDQTKNSEELKSLMQNTTPH